ncbi:MAG: TlpA disulfide reductase family protein [Acidobacteriota bacterium]|nr:TlpA disulfide reductase family protein [Acidobacteriota bacterium]
MIAVGVLLGVACAGSGADPGADDLDREIRAEIDRAWDEVREFWDLQREGEATEEDDPQPELARELYEIWVEHPDTDAGARALQGAFAMWGNSGGVDAILEVIPTIDKGSEVWAAILNSISNAYGRSGRWEEFKELRASLETELSHPKARSEIYLDIARELVHQDGEDEARSYYEQVIALDADEFYVERATGNLYEMDSLGEGDGAPGFSAKDMNGNPIELAKLRGDIVLIEFWSTTCGPCLPEIAHLKKIHEAHGGDDFTLIGVALDDEATNVKNLLDGESMAWPQIMEGARFDGEISKKYNVYYIPRSFLIDADGKIVAKDLRGEKLEQAVAEALN